MVAPERLALAGKVWRVIRQIAIWNAPARILSRAARSVTRLDVVSCADDHREFVAVHAWRWPLTRLTRAGRLRLAALPELDHSLLTRTAQLAAIEVATRFVEELDPQEDAG